MRHLLRVGGIHMQVRLPGQKLPCVAMSCSRKKLTYIKDIVVRKDKAWGDLTSLPPPWLYSKIAIASH
ncbi:hypothetical protein L3X38_003773 [Prunus dulcis]|uniref:Uncharacterized protein n=1 Tax=Prunus dulcis TaxID=3755 RepID=A0AAD5F2F3_PRUDU|nr:hypothetical protein L3X38_003773 [Prunus dulcis]